jgi:transcriptional regulator NrdR family protein
MRKEINWDYLATFISVKGKEQVFCPRCLHNEETVKMATLETRNFIDPNKENSPYVQRRKCCPNCGERFTTIELLSQDLE